MSGVDKNTNSFNQKLVLKTALSFLFVTIFVIDVDEVVPIVPGRFQHIVTRLLFIQSHHLLPLATAVYVSDDGIEGILLGLISLIYALSCLIVAYPGSLTEVSDNN